VRRIDRPALGRAQTVGVGVALPYPTINLVGSALFLATCGFAYSLLGTLNFAGMSVRADTLAGRPVAG